MKKKLVRRLELPLFLLLIAVCVLLAINRRYSTAVTNGVCLWFACVLPALFPYFFITTVLSSLSVTSKIAKRISPVTVKAFSVNGCVGYALIMSFISGYPLGAKIISDLKNDKLISNEEAVRGSALCSFSSPMFLIGSVGSIMFNSTAFGLALFLCHFLSVLLTGFIFSFYKRKTHPPLNSEMVFRKADFKIYESVYSSVTSVLSVGGIITLFYLLCEILSSLNLLTPLNVLLTPIFGENIAKTISLGIFECTLSLKNLSLSGITPFSLPVACACCSFGGLSVIVQSVAFLSSAKIKIAPFFLSKILSAIFAFVLGLIFNFLVL